MKIQNLAIIFIIIILPISLVFASYTKNRVETINLQSNYDSKLNDATHDAIKAYQLNSFSNVSGSLTNSKIRDIKASINTFFNSLSTNFSTLGYTKTTLQNYVPALVYTMYDGYYIYSPLTNTLNTKNPDSTDRNDDIANEMREQIGNAQEEEYQDLQTIYDLKPYVYYSCQYKTQDGNIDVVITYSLDNYIQIQGTIKGQLVSKQGYLLNDVQMIDDNTVRYDGIEITRETPLSEYVFTTDDNLIGPLPYTKINGSKYYKEGNGNVFTLLNDGKKLQQNRNENEKKFDFDYNAFNYYKEAYNLRNFIEDNDLDKLTTRDIVDVKTKQRYGQDGENSSNPYYAINEYIFDFNNIESKTSNFNTHRIDVIKHSIEKNLSIAIANFNNYSGVSTDFQMPRLKDSDWDKIMSNISLISFFQGANIGGKVYNGYSIVTNTKNEDVVMEDSIYIKKGDTIYNIADKNLLSGTDPITVNNSIGIFNINAEPRAGIDGTTYYMPVTGTLSYGSIITKDDIDERFDGDVRKYVRDSGNDILKKIYYTALGRERYGLYRLRLEIN